MIMKMSDIVKTVASNGTAEALATNGQAKMLILEAKKVGGDNTGKVYLGISNVDKTSRQIIELAAGDRITLTAPKGDKFDLTDFWLDAATNGDGVVGLYWY